MRAFRPRSTWARGSSGCARCRVSSTTSCPTRRTPRRAWEARSMGDEPTIYEWAGGREAFARWLNAFYDLVEGDAEIVGLFGGQVSEEHRDHVTAWWSEVMGGPPEYSERHGGYEHMLARHRGLGITADMRLRFV